MIKIDLIMKKQNIDAREIKMVNEKKVLVK
jgi:hypothetical protein